MSLQPVVAANLAGGTVLTCPSSTFTGSASSPPGPSFVISVSLFALGDVFRFVAQYQIF